MKKKHTIPKGVIAALILLLLFGAAVAGIMYWERKVMPQTLIPSRPVATEELVLSQEPHVSEAIPMETTEHTMPTLPDGAMNGKYTLNILLIGEDQWDIEEYGRSDTMILCSIDSVRDTVTMVSFLRDIYVNIPGYRSNRLNSAYALGGAQLLVDTLEENFGVSIDATVEIDFNGYVAMIDYLGGVDINLTAEEARYLNSGEIWTPDHAENWNLSEGQNRLNGSQTLAYSRIRYLDSDFVRTERQRAVLEKLMKKFHDADWQQMMEAMDCLLEQSKISMTEQELLMYTIGFYPVLMNGSLVSQQIPADDTWSYETIRGMSVIRVDFEANRQLLAKILPLS